MEVPYEREAEVIGVDLQTRRRPSNSQHPNKTNIITSDLSDTSDFEYSVSMENAHKNTGNNKNGTIIITNGENPKIIEGRFATEVLTEDNEEKLANFDERYVAQNEDTNGFSVHHNGGHVDEVSLPESNGIPAGLRFVLDGSSNGDNVESSEFYNGENMVNKTQIINDQNEIVETGQSQEVEPEKNEYEVERVIRNQETHDLICPNCNTCITKRVILKKRKRTQDKISEDEPNLSRIPNPTAPDTDKGEPEHKISSGEGASDSIDAVSCFSCFSIFVPKGDGFLCWRFKPKPPVTLQPGEAGDSLSGFMQTVDQPPESETETRFPMWILTCCQPYHADKPVGKPEPESSPASENGKKFPSKLPPSTPPRGAPVTVDRAPPVTPEGDTGPSLPSKPLPDIKPDDDIPSLPNLNAPNTSENDYVIVPIPQPSPVGTSETGPTANIKGPLPTLTLEHPRPGVSGVDIIKAIVYGGLLECITSLSVISSAAGGDATTLNIVALGLANAVGGLVLLFHNLRVLKHEHGTERYIDQLGSPGHFMLHAVVAVISYLVFGLMSPVIYGFAFRLSDNKDYKLATLAAASLVCIAILSIAKAYVRRPPKAYIQTIFYYIGVGFSVSGAGYAAGHFINILLKDLGVFDPNAPVAMSVLEAGAMKGAWSSD